MKLRKRLGLPDRDFATLTNEELNAVIASESSMSWLYSLAVKEKIRRLPPKPRKYKKEQSKTVKKLSADPPQRAEA